MNLASLLFWLIGIGRLELEGWLLVLGHWNVGRLFGRLVVGIGRLERWLLERLLLISEDWKVGCWKIGRLVMVLVVGIGRLEGWLLFWLLVVGRLKGWLLVFVGCCFGCWFVVLVVGIGRLAVSCCSRTHDRRGSADFI